MMFRLWESFNSYKYDEQMLQFISKLAELHVNPEISDPKRIEEIPDDELSEGEGRPKWDLNSSRNSGPWQGLYNHVGIFTDHEWNLLMCKCLASMGERYGLICPELQITQVFDHRNSSCRRRVFDYGSFRRQPSRIRDWASASATMAHS